MPTTTNPGRDVDISRSRLPKASDLLAERLRAPILGEGMRPATRFRRRRS